MKPNKSKTKVMVMGDTKEKLKIQIDDIEINQVESFRYLGVEIQENGKQEGELNARL